MDLTPAEMAIVELLRAMGSEPLHLSFTCTGSGVAFSLVTTEAHVAAGWGSSVEEAMSNAYTVPDPEPQAKPARAVPRGGRDGRHEIPAVLRARGVASGRSEITRSERLGASSRAALASGQRLYRAAWAGVSSNLRDE